MRERLLELRARMRRRRRGAPPPLTMGRFSYGRPRVLTYEGDDAVARVGAFVSIGDDVTFLVGGNHRLDWVTTFPFRARLGLPGAFEDGHPVSKGDTVIGNDVWIGRGATILPGVRVGDGAAIGARAVVGRDVRPYAVVAGNPARELRRRFTDEQIDRLLRIRWWEWPDDVVRARVDDLNGLPIDGFISAYDPAG